MSTTPTYIPLHIITNILQDLSKHNYTFSDLFYSVFQVHATSSPAVQAVNGSLTTILQSLMVNDLTHDKTVERAHQTMKNVYDDVEEDSVIMSCKQSKK